MQDPPSVIPSLVEKWQEGYDLVYAQRKTRAGETFFKLFCCSMFYRLLDSISEIKIPLDTGDFRLMDRRMVNALKQMPERHRLIRGMTSWVGYRQIGVQYDRDPRFAGETKYPFRKLLNLALDGLMSFSVLPLRMTAYVGGIMFALAMVGITYALILRLFTNAWVPGWTMLFISQMLFGGIQFIVLGVLGEYIGRIYTEAKQRPLYFIGQAFNFVPDLNNELLGYSRYNRLELDSARTLVTSR